MQVACLTFLSWGDSHSHAFVFTIPFWPISNFLEIQRHTLTTWHSTVLKTPSFKLVHSTLRGLICGLTTLQKRSRMFQKDLHRFIPAGEPQDQLVQRLHCSKRAATPGLGSHTVLSSTFELVWKTRGVTSTYEVYTSYEHQGMIHGHVSLMTCNPTYSKRDSFEYAYKVYPMNYINRGCSPKLRCCHKTCHWEGHAQIFTKASATLCHIKQPKLCGHETYMFHCIAATNRTIGHQSISE